MIDVIGSIAFGLVWGWLVVLIWGRPPLKRPYLSILVAALSTLPFAGLVYGLTTIPTATNFLIATAVSAIIHLLWLTNLKQTVTINR